MTEDFKNVSKRHWKLKEKARLLRSQGWSYKEIKCKVPVAKSTISLWCRDIELTKEQTRRLWEKCDTSLKGIKAIQKMFWQRRCDAFMRGVARGEKKVTINERFIAGLMLYWAEGSKSKHSASIANSDPRVIRFMAQWFNEFFKVANHEFSIYLHLHTGQDENKIKEFWSKLTGIPIQNFGKSFVKPEGSGYRKKILYNGTVQLTIKRQGSTYLLFEILGGLSHFLNQVLEEPIRPEDWMSKLPYA